jgi:hypothetical protein
MNDTCVALLSDFGSRDVYAGVMKGVIAGVAPRARLIDLTHEIPPGDVRQAAFRLWQAFPFMPRGTVFLAVVDPGVGTSRRAIAIRGDGFFCVGPDNGVFTYLLENRGEIRAVEIQDIHMLAASGASPASTTFHGRDVFAPAAGLLASGTNIARLGPAAADLLRAPFPRFSNIESEGSIRGEVLFSDRFGNLVTSIGALVREGDILRLKPWIPGSFLSELPTSHLRVRLDDGRELPLVRTFAEVPAGAALAYIGSDNLLEIGVNRGNAAESLRLASGNPVSLLWR